MGIINFLKGMFGGSNKGDDNGYGYSEENDDSNSDLKEYNQRLNKILNLKKMSKTVEYRLRQAKGKDDFKKMDTELRFANSAIEDLIKEAEKMKMPDIAKKAEECKSSIHMSKTSNRENPKNNSTRIAHNRIRDIEKEIKDAEFNHRKTKPKK